METAKQKSPFWTFSLTIYGKPGVPPACLTLQDGSGVDVNVFLFALYVASEGRQLTPDDMARIMASIDPWKVSAVVPLRGVRRYLKDLPAGFEAAGIEELRKRVKAVELESERLQQETLFALWPAANLGQACAPAQAGPANVRAYEQALKTTFDAAAVSALLSAFNSIME